MVALYIHSIHVGVPVVLASGSTNRGILRLLGVIMISYVFLLLEESWCTSFAFIIRKCHSEIEAPRDRLRQCKPLENKRNNKKKYYAYYVTGIGPDLGLHVSGN